MGRWCTSSIATATVVGGCVPRVRDAAAGRGRPHRPVDAADQGGGGRGCGHGGLVGMVENQFPQIYCWRGYLEIVELAKRYGLSVRAVMAFHQRSTGPLDPLCVMPRRMLRR
ncbi:beta-amylase [Salvia divinorum]|uniref:Beta-amylase n=1 Tax=Salvia divinorum TaxID=28513 RepID=A0ABD1HIV2_SALDI